MQREQQMRCLVSQGDTLPLSDSVLIVVPVSRILLSKV